MSHSIFSNNEWFEKACGQGWIALKGGVSDVVEPASGETLTRVAKANAQDVREACQSTDRKSVV